MSNPAPTAGGPEAEPGTYEVLRDRLLGAARELGSRARALNERRVRTYGGGTLDLAGTHRVHTEHAVLARDIVQVGGLLLIGCRTDGDPDEPVRPADVFALYRRTPDGFAPAPPDAVPGLLDDPRFEQDFTELFRYFRDTRLLHLRDTGSHLLAVFRVGERLADIRVLRWRLGADGRPTYLDAQGEREHVLPPAHDFAWTASTRADHVPGRHPHIAIENTLYVATVDGRLTIKVVDDTETAEGVYAEPIEDPLQSLADADVEYARVGPLLLVRVRPYREDAWRYLVHDTRAGGVLRLDGIGAACRRLPDEQGIVFPGGYHLSTGTARTFDIDTTDLEFESTVRSPNGEDVLYTFHARVEGRVVLLSYNVIREEAAAPIVGHGRAFFADGTMAVLRPAGDEPTRVHSLQVWHTPYTSDAYAAARPAGTGPLARVGNPELVRGIADCLAISAMAEEMAPTTAVFVAITAAAARVEDTHHWLADPELGSLAAPLAAVRGTAGDVVEEFRRVLDLRRIATEAVEEAAASTTTLTRRVRGETPDSAAACVRQLTELRRAQGRLAGLREIRYVDAAALARLDATLVEELAATGRRALTFLADDDAFAGTHRVVDELTAEAAATSTVAASTALSARIDEQADGLRVVTEVVGTLEGTDATVRTAILTRIGEVLGAVNRARATLRTRRHELLEAEQRAEFTAEFALLEQTVVGALSAASTPEECDEHLGRLLARIEELEARFGTFDEHLARIGTERERVHDAFSARKQARLDERARHGQRLIDSAGRILTTIGRRIGTLAGTDEINTYFASDALVDKVRSIAEELRGLGDPVRAGELDGRLKAARQEAARASRDRAELYDAAGTVRLGRHRFAVHERPIELTLVPDADGLAFAITGTDYRAPVRAHLPAAHRVFRDQPLGSESPQVYRAEYLAAVVLAEIDVPPSATPTAEELLADVRRIALPRHGEGYDRGVHDHDAAVLLAAVLRLRSGAGLLRFAPDVRAAAQLFWAYGADPDDRARWITRAQSLARARRTFGPIPAVTDLAAELGDRATAFLTATLAAPGTLAAPNTPGTFAAPNTPGTFAAPNTPGTLAAPNKRGTVAAPSTPSTPAVPTAPGAALGAYLFEELAAGGPRFATGAAARTLVTGFWASLGGEGSPAAKDFAEDLRALGDDLAARRQLVTAWLGGYADRLDGGPQPDLAEAIAIELCGEALDRHPVDAPVATTVTGLLGAHPRLGSGGTLNLRLDEFLVRTDEFHRVRVPAHRAYQHTRAELLAAERERLGLDAHTPKVMPTFVRNRLIDEVYLPLIGADLAGQLGAVGEQRRTDSQGLLLLLSPPGYGKTTLLEYVAARLGLAFVRIDGPALGYRTTSLDPAAAPDAAARREIEKIGFALELGNNVLLHLDDIQHVSPELLQKFVSLCDAQRRIDGVRDGEARAYDLRGKRFAMSMAGNPYTESGARFRIPDMLANRADVWNLGDVLGGKEDLFALSHIENALTANPILAPIAGRERADLELLVRLARGDEGARSDRLAHPYDPAELDRVLAVLGRLLRVCDTVLAVNRAYIASAAQSESARTEPPFRLQGSYRDTNRLAERLLPVLDDSEVDTLVDDHYTAQAQTLTTDAEANLLKLAELRGRLGPADRERWAEVRRAYRAGRA
ncbi:DNA repair ATPase [Embleya sp. NBC_00888]|uniref:DNA repair ATPase n=1 Tax=Embleya sp. NBC_00888 TaxID=2975960 RepID=UPI00386C95B1|nr:DNA repair ATPase [Embleya sp. NBC_00888]